MRVTFSTFVTPTRDSDTRVAGAEACPSGTGGGGVGSIGFGAYPASRRLAVTLWDRADLVLFGELCCRSFPTHDRAQGPLGGGRHAVRGDGLLRAGLPAQGLRHPRSVPGHAAARRRPGRGRGGGGRRILRGDLDRGLDRPPDRPPQLPAQGV